LEGVKFFVILHFGSLISLGSFGIPLILIASVTLVFVVVATSNLDNKNKVLIRT
jgi:hypothetical protein